MDFNYLSTGKEIQAWERSPAGGRVVLNLRGPIMKGCSFLKPVLNNTPALAGMAKNPYLFQKIFLLLFLLFSICAENFAQTKPDMPGFDKTIFDYHFEKADREISPERWMQEARRGISLAKNAWEKLAIELYSDSGDPLLLQEAEDKIDEWSEAELEKRFIEWLEKRFFNEQSRGLISDISLSAANATLQYAYHLDENGNLLIDENTGDILIIRPGDEGREFETDLLKWHESIDDDVRQDTEAYYTGLIELYPEILAYIAPENRADFEQKLQAASLNAYKGLQNEFESIIRREERNFIARRLGDVYSLRRQSEQESAEAIAAHLIEETNAICNEGISAIESKIEAAKAGTGDMALEGEEWLKQYEEQFRYGLQVWQDAEERFFVRMAEWEQDAGIRYTEGEEAWSNAFSKFENERRKWEENAKSLFDSGEALFRKASDTLNSAIAEAKIEFERDMLVRIEVGTARARAWVDMYVTSGSIVAGAKENIEFWLEIYGDNSAPSFLDNEFEEWLNEELRDCLKIIYNNIKTVDIDLDSAIEEVIENNLNYSDWDVIIRNNEDKFIQYYKKYNSILEIQKWFELYNGYLGRAIEARNALINDFDIVMGTGGLTDILKEGVSSEDFYLDEYQIELIRAKAVSSYWEKKVNIAEAVLKYAEDLSSGRITEGEGLALWKDAKQNYDDAVIEYEKQQKILNEAGADVVQAQSLLNDVAQKLKEADAVLQEINRDYQILYSAYIAGGNDFIKEEMLAQYKNLLEYYSLLRKTGEDAVYINYLESACKLGFSEKIEIAGNKLKEIITGNNGKEKTLKKLKETLTNILIPDTIEIIEKSPSDYGLEKDNNYYAVISEVIVEYKEKIEELDEKEKQGVSDEDDYNAEKKLVNDHYGKLILILLKTAKAESEQELTNRLNALNFLISDSSLQWYNSYIKNENFNSGEMDSQDNIEELLYKNYDQAQRNLLVSRIELERDVLKNLIDNNSEDEKVKLLSFFCIIDKEEIQEDILLLDELLVIINNNLEGNRDEYKKSLEEAAGRNKMIQWFIQGGSFFNSEYGSFITGAILEEEKKLYDASRANLLVYQDIFNRTPLFEKEIWEQNQKKLKELFLSYNIDTKDHYLPDPVLIADVLAGKSGDIGKNTAELLIKLDELFQDFSSPYISEIETWKNSLVKYIASYSLYKKLTLHNSDNTLLDAINNNKNTINTIQKIYEIISIEGIDNPKVIYDILDFDLETYGIFGKHEIEEEAVRRIAQELVKISGTVQTENEGELRQIFISGIEQYYNYVHEKIRDKIADEALAIYSLQKAIYGEFDTEELTEFGRAVVRTIEFLNSNIIEENLDDLFNNENFDEIILFRLKYYSYTGNKEKYEEEFALLSAYIDETKSINPENTVRIEVILKEAESFDYYLRKAGSYLNVEISGDLINWILNQNDLNREDKIAVAEILFNNIQSDPFMAALHWDDNYNTGRDQYYEMIIYELDNVLSENTSVMNRLVYEKMFYDSFKEIQENVNTSNISEKKHWREYIGEIKTKTEDNIIEEASSFIEGIYLDSLYNATIDTNKLNEALVLYNISNNTNTEFINIVNSYLSNNNKEWNIEDIIYIRNLVKDEYYVEEGNLYRLKNYINSIESELANLGYGYELSSKKNKDIEIILEGKKKEIDELQVEYDILKNEYSEKAFVFSDIGNKYDTEYKKTKLLYENMENARQEYEKHDAIKRWASTSYLESSGDDFFKNISYNNYKNPSEELIYNREQLLRANAAFDAVSKLYDNTITRREYNDPVYHEYLAKYEESFGRMMLSMKTLDLLKGAIQEETNKNAKLYKTYRTLLDSFYYGTNVYNNYNTGKEKSKLSIYDLITIDENGMLKFSTDSNYRINTVDENTAKKLSEYFSKEMNLESDPFPVTQIEKKIRELLERMQGYNFTKEKYIEWGLAKDYLISQLIANNNEISYLENFDKPIEALSKGKNLGDLVIDENNEFVFAERVKVYQMAGYYESVIANEQKNAWENLSAQERSDLEFYFILLLIQGKDPNTEPFNRISEYKEYEYLHNFVQNTSNYFNKKKKTFLVGFLWNEISSIVNTTRSRIKVSYDEINNKIQEGLNNQRSFIADLNRSLANYKVSSSRLAKLTGNKSDNSFVNWSDIKLSLETTKLFSNTEILNLEQYWEDMLRDIGGNFKNVSDALTKLAQWAKSEKEDTKRKLEEKWSEDENERQKKEKEYRLAYENYINGNASLDSLQELMLDVFGDKAPAGKNHLENLESVIINDLNGVVDDGSGYASEFSSLAEEYVAVIKRAYNLRYNAEISAREIEWAQKSKDLIEKMNTWKETSALILERGRYDWKVSMEKLQDNYYQWVKKFEEEYERVKTLWSVAYMEGLNDKEAWIEEATKAAGTASSEALLAMIGADAEAGVKAMDTRDPMPMSVGNINDVDNVLNELLNSSGITNLTDVFNTLNGTISTISVHTRRGIGGPAAWDSGIIAVKAKEFAEKTNEELAAREAKKIAVNAEKTKEDAVQGITDQIYNANLDFENKMDEIFIMNGQWLRNGNNYVKDVIVHSTAFDPVITEHVTVQGYKEYFLSDPIIIKTDLSENKISNLDSLAVHALIQNMQNEVKAIMEKIFGTEEENSAKRSGNGMAGEFGLHIGDQPELGGEVTPEKNENEIFQDPGSGQYGELMRKYIYWMIQESAGIGKVNRPSYEKPMWDSRGSGFDAPSLRTIADIGMSAVVMAVGIAGSPFTGMGSFLASVAISTAINMSDDLLFTALDVSGGYKDAGEAWFEFGKKTVITAASTAVSGTFNGIGKGVEVGGKQVQGLTQKAIEGVTSNTGKVLVQTAMVGVQSAATAVTTGLLSGITYNHENGWGYSTQAAGESILGGLKGGLVSMAGTFTGGMLNGTLEGFTENLYNNGTKLTGLLGGLAGQGVNFAMGGDFTLNLFNLSVLKNENLNMGLLELRIGHDDNRRVSMGIGSGGVDVSGGTLIGAIKGLETVNVNLKLLFSKQQEARTYASPMRTLYSLNGKNREEFDNILIGKTHITQDMNNEGTESVYNWDSGEKTITLGQNALNDKSRFGLNVFFSHEAHRDGFDSGEQGQIDERNAAVLGHIVAAKALIDTYGNGVIGEQMTNEVNALKSGNLLELLNIVNQYDTSADYWKLKQYTDGRLILEDDKQYDTLTIEYLKKGKDKDILLGSTSNKIDTTNVTGRAAGLAKMIGLDRIAKLLNTNNLKNSWLYDFQTLKDVYKISDNDEVQHILKSGILPVSTTEAELLSLAGEALLKSNNLYWNKEKNSWGSGDFTITNNILRGNLYTITNEQGGLDFYTLTEAIMRNSASYLVIDSDGKINRSYTGLDALIPIQRDLDGFIVNILISDNWTTVQTQVNNEAPYYRKDDPLNDFADVLLSDQLTTVKVGPETIAPGDVSYRLAWRENTSIELQLNKGDPFFIAVDGNIMGKDEYGKNYSIYSDGTTALSDLRLLQHPTNNFTNEGCLVTGNIFKTNGKQNWDEYMDFITQTAKVPYNYVMKGKVIISRN
jgi:hypothetical protein